MLPLPPHQYECTLYRRAVRKKPVSDGGATMMTTTMTRGAPASDGGSGAAEEDSDGAGRDGDDCGDVSLGMKLTVVGGRVIVQQLNALEDGRASPAQLAGVIKRGDVLLAVDGCSLLNLPIDQLMRGLSPLSAPEDPLKGTFRKALKLRFASGEGLALLSRGVGPGSSSGVADPAASSSQATVRRDTDGAADMFGLFPMVDQLSGMPLFESESHQIPLAPSHPDDAELSSSKTGPRVEEIPTVATTQKLSLDEQISSDVARDRQRDKYRFVRAYFAWRGGDDGGDEGLFSDALRGPISTADPGEGDQSNTEQPPLASSTFPLAPLTLNQLVERGRRAVVGAGILSDGVEAADRGNKEGRSLKSWKTTLSLYSRTSERRRAAMRGFDTASMPVDFGRLDEEKSDDGSDRDDDGASADRSDSSHSDEGQPLDADAQLVRSAATDAVWRRQVIEYLKKVTEEREQRGRLPEHAEAGDDDAIVTDRESNNIDLALSAELGSFLFGDKMSRIITKSKKSLALPPDEITALLFDLTTKLIATIPTEVDATATRLQESRHSFIAPLIEKKRITSDPGTDVQIASRFLLEDVLPVWLDSFKPLPWDQRRILWPLDKPTFGGSTTASSTFSDDSFTQESVGVASHLFSGGSSPKVSKRSKNLRERIEDLELNAESRAET
jgi:hypothetical protein